MKHPVRFLLLFVLCILAFSIPAGTVHAFTFENADTVTVPSEKVMQGTVFLTGQRIRIDGTVNGDVYCAGQDIRITGTVTGDILCAGQHVSITGVTHGNVRSAAQDITLTGQTDRNVLLLGQRLTTDASVSGEFIGAGQDLQIGGLITRDALLLGQFVSIGATINGDTKVTADKLTFTKPANIHRDISYESPEVAILEPGASLSGNLIYKESKRQPADTAGSNRNNQPDRYPSGMRVFSFVCALLAALLLQRLFPVRMMHAADSMELDPLKTIGMGFLLLIGVPFLCIILFMTILGIPVSLLLISAYVLAIMLSKVFVGIVVGRVLIHQYWPKYKQSLPVICGTGLLISWLIYSAPVIGGMVSFIAVLWGLGGIYYLINKR